MPVMFRTFYMRKLINVKEKEKEHNNSIGKQDAPSSKIVKGPQIGK